MKNKSKSVGELLFVYNADSGIGNALLDYGKKYIQPDKYDCQLCMVTYGALGMKKDWKKFTASLPYPVKFLHRDEFEALYPNAEFSYPTVILIDNGHQQVLISNEDFENIKSLDDLMVNLSSLS